MPPISRSAGPACSCPALAGQGQCTDASPPAGYSLPHPLDKTAIVQYTVFVPNATQAYYRTRWFVLQRDNFTCQYCGQKAPDVVLAVDHKGAKALGGDDSPDNLVACCTACNLGKSDVRFAPQAQISLASWRPRRVARIAPGIAAYLHEHGAATGKTLAEALHTQQSTVSRILKADSQFEFAHRVGRHRYYRLRPPNPLSG